MVHVRHTCRQFTRTRTRSSNNDKVTASLDIVVFPHTLRRNDMIHIRWVALDRVVDVRRDAIFFQLITESIGCRLTRILCNNNRTHIDIELVELINQTKDLLVVGDAKVTTSLRMLDIAGINSNNHFDLIFELLKELDFIVRFITREDTGSMEIFQHLTTKLQVELAVKLVNTLQNMVALQIQILFRTKSLFLHK